MSLDVYLYGAARPSSGSGIFVREGGRTVEISREEWDAQNPGREPVVFNGEEPSYSYTANITHNLGKMAAAADLYGPLWRPDENDLLIASDLVEPLERGLAILLADPDRFRELNPANGWGDYEGLVRFTEAYLDACREMPDAKVRVSR